MSKKFPEFSEDPSPETEIPVKRKQVDSEKRTKKKTARSQPKKVSKEDEIASALVVKAPVAEAKVPVPAEKVPPGIEPKSSEPDTEITANMADATESSGETVIKRKRRRRKSKAGGAAIPVETGKESAVVYDPKPVLVQKHAKQSVAPEQLAKSAWKIYLAEISEEGVALVSDQDARELARRCFSLAEIFLEEKNRA